MGPNLQLKEELGPVVRGEWENTRGLSRGPLSPVSALVAGQGASFMAWT